MPPESSVRILFVGDMHLGRLPSRVPERVLDKGRMKLLDLGPGAAWERIVEAALHHQVHAVALAGDLVEGNNAMFEAYGPLATGVRRLVEQGVIVAAVAGNHDTRVLPRLAEEIDGFHLLGPGGTWSTLEVPGDHGQIVHLAGWSFPDRHHTASPLLTAPPHPEGITFGVLHADLDASHSDYAPVRSADLQGIGYQGWFLGHVHKPGNIPSDGAPFYLGSVTGLDAAETTMHGPVLVQVAGGGKLIARRLPLAPLRWEHCELNCTGLDDPASMLADHLIHRTAGLASELKSELDNTRALGLRITLTGDVADPAALERTLRGLDYGQLVTRHEETVLFIQKVINRVTTKVDLNSLAAGNDPPGLLARQILALEDPARPVPGVPDPAALATELVEAARLALHRVDRDRAFQDLADESGALTGEEIRRMIVRSGRLALADLLAQDAGAKEAGHAAG